MHNRANPIRKVVKMLQSMQTKVTEEGKRDKKLFDKFACFCKTSRKSLDDSIAKAQTKIPSAEADVKTTKEQKQQIEEKLKRAKADRAKAQESMAQAKSLREKGAKDYAAEKTYRQTTIASMKTAIAAIVKGTSGSFLQTTAAEVLRRSTAKEDTSLYEEDRQTLLSFLRQENSDSEESSPGEVKGILSQMQEEFEKDLKKATEEEEAQITSYLALTKAKKDEIAVLTASVEKLLEKVGELGVATVQVEDDLADTKETYNADTKFKANLEKDCTRKTADFEQRQKMRTEELTALADTIKVLNEDDALDVFKKTLPSSSSASFLQIAATSDRPRRHALQRLQEARRKSRAHRPHFGFIAMTLKGKKQGFEKVVKMVDTMIQTLKKEQADDTKKKEYCSTEFDLADDKKKGLERTISDKEAAIEDAKGGLESLREEEATLTAGIKRLDASVAEATQQRKQEHEEHKELMAMNGAAKEILTMAKNRLGKFYGPAADKAPKEDGGDAKLVQFEGAPPVPPETMGAYSKKSGQSQGVMEMINLLISELSKEMTVAEVEDKDAQKDYEELMADSNEKRKADAKALTEKESTRTELEKDLEGHKDDKASASKELLGTKKFIMSLHGECDWLIQYFDVRKKARENEMDALTQSKAVLSGADYSFLQTARHHLRASR